ncbi:MULTISPECIES: DEAD/DEAH box helicase [Paenibacillus]|uniref:DEAD/DEAH box helicase n=1 Tax=Paenibacillus TaxID=44249 RepID=UPI0022B88769|nr:DEAD/DEAH box helicase [Paenibacillus caseinilyticus]MCZ8519246.1 DEAD/DEAH box helicase [Paenibacillus caseinilyticus]
MEAWRETGVGGLHPVLASWFHGRFGEGTDVQVQAFGPLQAGEHVLIAAPTGSGKTLAALLPCLDWIIKAKEAEETPEAKVRLLYITPLKALNNDVHHHVMGYIPELQAEAARLGLPWPGLSAGVRTGDTTQRARAAMLRQPPDVLVTTPESLYILLTSVKGKAMLKHVSHLIVDEIHDLAGGDRGLHLSVTLERLTTLCGRTPQRIGVSATQRPIERVARYLGGWEAGADADPSGSAGGDGLRPRDVRIIESRMDKVFRLSVTMPEQAPITQDRQEALWAPLTERIVKLMEGARSVLVFTNNRRLCERLTLRLNDHVGYEMARSHHGSVSREQRLEVERALKAGELRCLVATSSLELGIDVGHIDLVLQIDSPKSAASGIQRIGRAGHGVGDVSTGIILARSRSLLAECAVLAAKVSRREIEEIRIPREALGVLCQQITAMVAGGVWTADDAFTVLRRSDSYHSFPRERFEAVLEVLSGYYPFVKPLLDWNRESGELAPRSITAMAAIMGAGTIPQGSAYPVHHANSRIHIGELDEEYIHESRVGDVFQLGTSSWKIQRIAGDRVYVTEAGESFSEIPFWRGEGQGRTLELSLEIGRFLEELEQRLDREAQADTAEWLGTSYAMDARSADELLGLVRSQKAVSVLPTHRRIVAERFQDEMKQHYLILHSPFGRKLNRTWQLALQHLFESKLPYRLYASTRDNGIQFVWPDVGGAAMEGVIALVRSVHSGNIESILRQAVPASPLFGSVFRRLAETSLLLPRSFKRMPAWKKRMRSESLLREALPYAERFPFLGEAMRVCLEEELDAAGLKAVLLGIEEGRTEWTVCENAFPSPFAAAFLADFAGAQIYESDAVSRDLQLQLLGMDRSLAGALFGENAVQALLTEEGADGGPAEEGFDAEQPGELLRYLKRRGDRSLAEIAADAGAPEAGVEPALAALEAEGRAAAVRLAGERRWIPTEEAQTYARLLDDPLALRFVLARSVEGSAEPFTVRGLAARYGIKPAIAAEAAAVWAEEGRIEPAPGSEAGGEPDAWVSREAQSRRIRQAVHAMRSRSEPAAGERYLARLLELQHVWPASRLRGEEGLREVIGRLQGCFLPLSEWEGTVFPLRLTDYRKELLDGLCASGEVVWMGRKEPKQKEGRVAFFLAEAAELYRPLLPARSEGGDVPRLLEVLRQKGASFVTALARESDRLPSEVTDELIALAWEGWVSSDQFSPLRQHGSGGSRSAAKARTPRAAPRYPSTPGRWYALEAPDPAGLDLRASLAAWVKGLLGGWGLLTRDLVKAQLPWGWDAVYGTLRQLESWGMLTRGLWVRDIPAMQYAAADMVESLRRPAAGEEAASGVLLLPSADPANPFGLTVRWPAAKDISFARKSGCDLLLYGGRWLYWSENNGRRVYTMPREDGFVLEADAFAGVVKGFASAYLGRPGIRKLVVDVWDGIPILEHPAAEPLRSLGAETDRASLVVWPSMIR